MDRVLNGLLDRRAIGCFQREFDLHLHRGLQIVDPKRDRFILSKGHAVPVLYSALCQAGYYTFEQIMTQ